MSELEAQLNSKEQEILHLFESNQKLQSELVGLRGEAVREREALKEEQGRRDAQVRAMEEKLASQKDYDDVKRELTLVCVCTRISVLKNDIWDLRKWQVSVPPSPSPCTMPKWGTTNLYPIATDSKFLQSVCCRRVKPNKVLTGC